MIQNIEKIQKQMKESSLARKILNSEELEDGDISVYDRKPEDSVFAMDFGFRNVLCMGPSSTAAKVIVPLSKVEDFPTSFSNSDLEGHDTYVEDLITQEEEALLILIDATHANHAKSVLHNAPDFSNGALQEAIRSLGDWDLDAQNILISSELVESFNWEYPGVLSKDNTVSGVTHSGQVLGTNVYAHKFVASNHVYVLAAPEFLGVMPSTVKDGIETSKGMAILNPNAVTAIKVG